MNRFFLSVIFLLLYFPFDISGETRDIMVKQLGTEEGLSHHTANAIYQDEFGFIWIGTMDGLNRFDGQKTKIFRPSVSESGGGSYNDCIGLKDNNIRQICGDQTGHLYIKGLDSVSEFDMRTASFKVLEDSDVRYIFHDGKALWIAHTSKISRINDGIREVAFDFDVTGLDNVAIDCFTVARNGDICICTNTHGFYRINSDAQVLLHLDIGAANSVFEDSREIVWIATRTEGLYMAGEAGEIAHYMHDVSDSSSLLHNNVRQVCEDSEGNFWIGTYGGVCKFNPEDGKFIRYRYESSHRSFDVVSIMSMICDRQGTLWFGSFYEGVFYYNIDTEAFVYYIPEKGNPQRMNSPIVNSISEDRDGNLWLATEGGGLSMMDMDTRKFKTLTVPCGLSSDVLKSTLYDSLENALYIATLRNGIDRYDIGSGRFRHYDMTLSDMNGNLIENVVMMKPFGNDSLLLATNYGLVAFNKKSGQMSKMETGFNKNYKAQVWDMEIDDEGNLWFTTSSDLYCYNIRNRSTRFYSFHDVTSGNVNNNFNSILLDRKGRLWFGSSGSGVFLYDRDEDSFSNIVPAWKMSNGYVTGLCEDRVTGYIYVATNNGLSRLCPETGEISIYNSANGFPLSNISENSLFITSSGELFASGMDGLVSVECKDLIPRPRQYDVYISGLLIDNSYVLPSGPGKNSILTEDILFQDRIVMRPGHSVISFEVSNTDYVNNSSVLLVEYKMEGFDQDFIKAKGADQITYTNLNAGNYTFKVKGLVPDLDGNYPSAQVSVRVVPPFYKTPLFFIMCLLVVSIIAFYIIRTYTTSERLRSLLDLEKREKTYINQVNQDKLRFFTNISHEFRTPLTLIDGQLELILQRNDLKPSVYSKILNVYHNSRRLRRLVDEIIDIRKQEAGKMKLKVYRKDIVSFLKEIYLSFEEYAEYRKINFTFTAAETSLYMLFDPVQLEKVFYNLLSNAFKFTKESGRICMCVQVEEGVVTVSVSDDGEGISPESLPHVFERFFQDDKQNARQSGQGSGIGLSLSKAIVEMHGGKISVTSESGKGTCFKVVLPERPVFKEDVVILEGKDSGGMDLLSEYSKDYNPSDFTVSDNIQKSAKILIVEDNDEVRNMLKQIFSPIYEVCLAADGTAGVDKAVAENPDIILSDVMMPGMSGFEMCRKLKDNMETSHIPIVLLTAKTAENQIVKGLQLGADDYVTKPFSVKILVARCNNLIESRRRLQQKYLSRPEASVKMLSENPKEQAMLEKAVEIVMQHIDNADFNIEMFAKEMGLSRTYLFTKIKGLTGQSPNEFMSTIRMKQALVKLRENPEASMVDIAYSLGFSSPSYFIKCFRQMYGKTPNSYRKELMSK